MRKGAGFATLILACALVMPIAVVTPVAAQASPTLSLDGASASSGPQGTLVIYDYNWDQPDCGVGVTDAIEIDAVWADPASTPMTPASADPTTCSGTVSGLVPGDASPDSITVSAVLCDDTTLTCPVPGSSVSDSSFMVTPTPTPTPIPTPNSKPNAHTHANACTHTDANPGSDLHADAHSHPYCHRHSDTNRVGLPLPFFDRRHDSHRYVAEQPQFNLDQPVDPDTRANAASDPASVHRWPGSD